MHDEYLPRSAPVRRSFDDASRTYDAAAAVHAEIRTRLLERLDIVRLAAAVVLDLGAGTGQAAATLKRRYPSAQVIAVDSSLRACCARARASSAVLRRFAPRRAPMPHRLPLRDASRRAGLQQPDAAVVPRSRRRVRGSRGACCGRRACSRSRRSAPTPCKELREVWRGIDAATHVHRFIDMHDLGDALLRAGFAEPVMDTERLTVTYPSLTALLESFEGSGARNVAQGRPRGPHGARARGAAVRLASDALTRNGPLPVSVEVIHGHAWVGGASATPRRGRAMKFGCRSRQSASRPSGN